MASVVDLARMSELAYSRSIANELSAPIGWTEVPEGEIRGQAGSGGFAAKADLATWLISFADRLTA